MEIKELFKLHTEIAERFEQICKGFDIKCDDRQCTLMDLDATSRAFPNFDWKGLLESDDANFCHDLGGIKRHIDRTTAFVDDEDLSGLFTECFVPRFARNQTGE